MRTGTAASGSSRRRRDGSGRLPRRIAADAFPIHKGERKVAVTISIGLAALAGPEDHAGNVLKRADQALYKAKRDGRNRVVADAA